MRQRIFALAGALMMAGLVCGAPQAAPPPPKADQGQPKPKSKAESDALMKVQTAAQANDPKAMLDAISNVLENFTDSDFKPMLLDMAVQAAQQTGDYANTIVWGDRAVQAMPNDIQARVIMAETIAANTHATDLDKDKSIEKITTNANQALDLLKNANAPLPGVPADKWPEMKAHLIDQAHDALGQADEINKKYPDAIKEFQAASDADPADPLVLARMTKTYNEMKQYDQAIAAADKVLAMKPCPTADNSPCLDARVKGYVTAQKNVATKLKAPTAPAAATSTPPSK